MHRLVHAAKAGSVLRFQSTGPVYVRLAGRVRLVVAVPDGSMCRMDMVSPEDSDNPWGVVRPLTPKEREAAASAGPVPAQLAAAQTLLERFVDAYVTEKAGVEAPDPLLVDVALTLRALLEDPRSLAAAFGPEDRVAITPTGRALAGPLAQAAIATVELGR